MVTYRLLFCFGNVVFATLIASNDDVSDMVTDNKRNTVDLGDANAVPLSKELDDASLGRDRLSIVFPEVMWSF
jgi:hypothetical protein